jgi:hypothetical protein
MRSADTITNTKKLFVGGKHNCSLFSQAGVHKQPSMIIDVLL